MSDEKMLYTIRDKVAEDCGPVYVAKNDGVALRSFFTLLRETVDPQDYELWCIAVYDSVLGLVTGYPVPRVVPLPKIKDEVETDE